MPIIPELSPNYPRTIPAAGPALRPPSGTPPAARRLARRAIGIEALVQWAYGTERVHRRDQENYGEPIHRACLDIPHEFLELGVRVDRSARTGAPGEHVSVDDDARAVHGRVAAMGRAGALIITHGAAFTRPDWSARTARLEPLYRDIYDDSGRLTDQSPIVRVWQGRKRQPYCPLRVVDTAALEDWGRATYDAWWAALDRLRRALAVGPPLVRFEVIPAMPPFRPWLRPVVKHSDDRCKKELDTVICA